MRRAVRVIIALLLMAVLFVSVSGAASLKVPVLKSVDKEAASMTVEWFSVKDADGYQIMYAKDSKFRNARKVTVKGHKTLEKKITGLEKKKAYYIKVRAYMNIDGKRIYSGWDAGCRTIVWNSDWKYAGFSSFHSTDAVLYYTYAEKKKGKTVALNAGHGSVAKASTVYNYCHPDKSAKVTGGSTAKGAVKALADNEGASKEEGRVLSIAKKTKRMLLKEGYNVLMLREKQEISLDVIGRTVMANNMADCHVAIHYDSTKNNKGAFYCSVPDNRKYRSMYPVSKHYKEHNSLGKKVVAGLKDNGIKKFDDGAIPIDLMQTSFSTIPSSDIEVGDLGTSYSSKNMKKMARGIADGIEAYFE